MNAELEPLTLRVLSALFNGGYQGLLLTAFVWLGLKLFPQTNAATRHAVGLATLLGVVALPMVHFLMVGAPARRSTVATVPPQVPPRDRQYAQAQPRLVTTPVFGEVSFQQQPNPQAMSGPASPEALAAWRSEPGPTTAAEEAPAASRSILPPRSSESSRLATVRRHWRASLSEQLALGLIGLWVGFSVLRLGNLFGECRLLCSLKRRSSPPPEPLRASFENLQREMGVGRKTRLLVVPSPAAPMAVGFLRPAVLLPASLYRRSGGHGLDQILRHELAHLRRWDDWSNLVQQAVRSAFFFHPGVWWLSRRLTLDREIACDDHVLAVTQTPRAYALFLTEFAGRIQDRNCSAAPAGWSRKSQLKERITMILDPKRNASTHLAKARAGVFTTAAALLAMLTLQAAPRLELAQARANQPAAEATPQISAEPALASTGSSALTAASGKAISSSAGVAVSYPAEPGQAGSLATAPSAPRPKPAPIPQPAPNVIVPVPPHAPAAAIPPQAIHAPHPVVVPHLDVQIANAEPRGIFSTGHAPVPRSESRADRQPRGGAPLEQRIERLERLIESLMERRGAEADFDSGRKTKPDDMSWKLKPDFQGSKMEAFSWEGFDGPKIAEITKQAEQIARQAQQEAERATRDANRIAQEASRAAMKAVKVEARNERGLQQAHSLEVQRKVLESQRHALEKQLGNLEAQIARLEQERDRIEARVDEHEGLLDHLEEQAEADDELELDIDIDIELDHDHESEADEESSRDRKPKRSTAEPSVKRAN